MEHTDYKSIEKLVELLKAGAIDEQTFLDLTKLQDNDSKVQKSRPKFRMLVACILIAISLIAGGWATWVQLSKSEVKTATQDELAKLALPYLESYAKFSAAGFERMKGLSALGSDADWYAEHQFNYWKAKGQDNTPLVTKIEGERIIVCGYATINDTSCRLNNKYSNFVFSQIDSSKLLSFDVDNVPIRERRKYASLENTCLVTRADYCGTDNSFDITILTTYLTGADQLVITYIIRRGEAFNKGTSYGLQETTAEIPGIGTVQSESFSNRGPAAGESVYGFVAFDNMSVAKGKTVDVFLKFKNTSSNSRFKISVVM
jgi:hypothetical protein